MSSAQNGVQLAGSLRYAAIITFGRSGSTVLQRALNLNPGVLIRGENFHAFYGMFLTHAAISRASASFRHIRAVDNPWFGSAEYRPDELLATQRLMALKDILKPCADTKLLGFKEIRYVPGFVKDFTDLSNYLVYLDRLFPGICFLINTRDPMSTAKSGWWPRDRDAHKTLHQTCEWLEVLPGELAVRLNRRATVSVRYEDWTVDCCALKEAWSFLGIPWDANAVKENLGKRLRH